MTDIVERLRNDDNFSSLTDVLLLAEEAAHEIELLRSELKLACVPAVPIEALQKIEQLSKENEALRTDSTDDLAEIDRLRAVIRRYQDEKHVEIEQLRADVEYYKLIWNQSEQANAQLCTTLAQIMSNAQGL